MCYFCVPFANTHSQTHPPVADLCSQCTRPAPRHLCYAVVRPWEMQPPIPGGPAALCYFFCYFCNFCYFALPLPTFCQYPQPNPPACSKLALQAHAPGKGAHLICKGVAVRITAPHAGAPCSFVLLCAPFCNFCYYVLLLPTFCQYPRPNPHACSKLVLPAHAPGARAPLLRNRVVV